MEGQLPDYKLKFLQEMDAIRLEAMKQKQISVQVPPTAQNIQIENNIINTSQYSSAIWKGHLNQTFYRRNHDDTHYELNLLVNPQIKKKQNNIQLTPISEYSNALHNKTVFINPKNTSC